MNISVLDNARASVMTGDGRRTLVCRSGTLAMYTFSELGLCLLFPLATAATTRNRYETPETTNHVKLFCGSLQKFTIILLKYLTRKSCCRKETAQCCMVSILHPYSTWNFGDHSLESDRCSFTTQ